MENELGKLVDKSLTKEELFQKITQNLIYSLRSFMVFPHQK